jgi:O-antigen/teichoic acid export membrane protein
MAEAATVAPPAKVAEAATGVVIAPAPDRGHERADGLHGTIRAVARGSTFVLGATLLWNVSNFAFNAVGARALGPGKYGQLTAVVALLYVVSPLLYTLQATSSGTAARLVSSARPGDVRPQLGRLLLRATAWAVLATALVAFAAEPIAHALRLPSPLPVLVLLASVPLAVIINLQRGALQGTGHFGRYAASTATEATAKIALVAALLVLWPNVAIAMLATIGALACAAIAHTRLLRALPAAAPATRAAPTQASRGGPLTLVCLVLLAILLSADVIAARHGMTSHSAGMYAAISLAGKIVFFATSGLTWVLFPMLSARDERGESGHKLLLGAVGSVALVAAAVAGVEWIAPSLVILPLAGHAYAGAAPWLARSACTFAPYAIAYLLAMGLAARRRYAAGVVLAVAAAAQLLALALITPSFGHLLAINAAVFTAAAVALAILCLRESGH